MSLGRGSGTRVLVHNTHTDTVSVECIEEANVDSASFKQRMNHMLYVIVLCYIVLKDTKE